MRTTIRMALAAAALTSVSGAVFGQEKLHFTYLWHLEQPIYWPDRQTTSGLGDRYERLGESLVRAGVHPLNNLNEIFGNDDRWQVYQDKVKDSVSAWAAFPSSGAVPEGGVQVSYSGGLIENIQSVAGTGWISGRYRSDWSSSYRLARSWTTFSGPSVPRLDVVIFPFHHALMPLLDESAMRKEIQTYKAIYTDAWGTGAPMSSGFFPSEMAFSTRMAGVLADEGIEWSIVSGEKISRACVNWPAVFGSGGTPCDPPNRADQLNPAQGDYLRLSIDRGCSPAEAYPYAFTPRRVRYVDPNTGVGKSIIAVPASQSLSWKDGYSPQGIADFDTLQAKAETGDTARPMLVVLAHDGDNAWGGGHSYYMEATPNRVAQARAAQYVPTVVQRYLADHPVPANDFVHVEDGAWVNADGDFGSPQFWNWNWPLVNASGQPDPVNGWAEDARNWAVITAMQNRVDTAEKIHVAGGGTVNARKIVYPHEGANAVERAWHYFLGGLNSGYMYYGTAIDMEVKPTVACNNAARLIDPVIAAAGAGGDQTGPTVWIPQRWPWNPGAQNFGGPHRQGSNYGPFTYGPDFVVWTFAYDVSGITSSTLKWRVDLDGQRTLNNTENETYAGGPGVSAWQSAPMNRRAFPAGNVYNDPTIDFFVMPQHIAEHFSAPIAGQSGKLIDYYVESVDVRGNITRSPIQHVYVGDGQGTTTPPSTIVTTSPNPPVAGQQVTISYDPTGRPLAGASQVSIHLGYNGWTGVITPDPAMSRINSTSPWTYSYTVPAGATVIDVVFNNGSSTWDNNGGADWHIAVTSAPPVSGRCCIGAACTVTLSSACSGAFTAGGDCAAPCPPEPTGACCAAAGAGCSVTTQMACAPGGAWTSGGACLPSPCAFVMDGNLDGDTVLAAQNGSMFLRAALRGDVLYVAVPNTPAGNDRFVYLAAPGGPGLPTGANWGKAGQVAAWSAFLGAEADNAYVGWQDQTTGATVGAAKGSVIEGTINLRQEFAIGLAALPDSVYLALAQFGTANGAASIPSLQCPVSNDANGNIDAAEFVRIPLCQFIAQGCCPADFNGVNGITIDDLFLYFNAYFSGHPSADFNGMGGVAIDDLFLFVTAWFTGC